LPLVRSLLSSAPPAAVSAKKKRGQEGRLTRKRKTTKTKTPRQILTLPTLLTLSRVAAVPLLVVLWYTSPPKLAALRLAALFAAASLTDAVDGYLARKWDQCTPFGAFLDPVADKLMVVTALLLIVSRPAASCAAGHAPWVVPAATAAVVGREIAMSALREWAAGVGGGGARSAAAVSWAGKLKTAAQMVAVSALLLASGRPCCAPAAGSAAGALHGVACAVGVPALVVSAVLAVASFGQYVAALWPWLSGARTD
jgi:CDP-diacylglycerol--glycerol-3-phosphate 3-phosphatidyltransferase